MPWLQLTIDIDPEHAPGVESLLADVGALAISLTDAADEALYEPLPGASPLWSQTRVSGLFTTATDLAVVAAHIADELGRELFWQIHYVADQDWERAWLKDFHPLSCGTRLWICPHGWPVPHPDAIILWLDPGLAFGTGNHPTTALCLAWLDATLRQGSTVVDYGCGSGILGLAALRLGALRCWAVDHDPQALRATLSNASQNGIDSFTSLKIADYLTGELTAPLWVGFPDQLPRIKADLLLANILARPLMELAPLFANLLQPAGQIVLSGILIHQQAEIVNVYQPWFTFQSTIVQEGWVCLIGQLI